MSAAAPPQRRIFSVSQVVEGLRELLEDRIGRVWVVGEISNLRVAASGHAFFTLKDDRAQLRATLFRGAARRIPFEPEDGLEVLVYGEVTVYEVRGDLQILVRHLEPRGRGALQLAVEQLRARLEREGLFDAARKRPLPLLPRCVGIVSSATGAALHDVIEVSGRRHAGVPLLIASSRVQGEGAEAEVCAALAALGARPEVEVILLVRGGGSLEDLMVFNGERVARAVAASRCPVVTGVGHEVDFTLADLAADARAPTPSAAAALVVPDRAELRARWLGARRHLGTAMRSRLARAGAALAQEREALRMLSPEARLAARRGRLQTLARALPRAARGACERRRARLATLAGRLESMSPLAVLARGYAIVQRAAGDAVVRDSADVAPGDALRIRLARGEIAARVVRRT